MCGWSGNSPEPCDTCLLAESAAKDRYLLTVESANRSVYPAAGLVPVLQRRELSRAQDLRGNDPLPQGAGSNTFAQRWFRRIGLGIWKNRTESPSLNRVDKRAVGAGYYDLAV